MCYIIDRRRSHGVVLLFPPDRFPGEGRKRTRPNNSHAPPSSTALPFGQWASSFLGEYHRPPIARVTHPLIHSFIHSFNRSLIQRIPRLGQLRGKEAKKTH